MEIVLSSERFWIYSQFGFGFHLSFGVEERKSGNKVLLRLVIFKKNWLEFNFFFFLSSQS